MYYTLIEALAGLAFLVPAALLLHRFRVKDCGRSLLYFLFTCYLAATYHLTGLPTVLFVTFDLHVNLIPTELFGKELVLSLLNIAMFVPLGFFLPLLWSKYRKLLRTMLFGLGATVAIELAQLLTYRATDINDVITNSTGAFLGYLLYLLLRKVPKCLKPEKQSGDLWILLAITLAGMFFLQPVIAAFLYKIT